MAAKRKLLERDEDSLSLHKMYRVLGDQMTPCDIQIIKLLYTAIMSEQMLGKIRDGYTTLLALEEVGRTDESNFRHIVQLLRAAGRHDLLPRASLKRRRTVTGDPVHDYLDHHEKSVVILPKAMRERCSRPTTPQPSNFPDSPQSPPASPSSPHLLQDTPPTSTPSSLTRTDSEVHVSSQLNSLTTPRGTRKRKRQTGRRKSSGASQVALKRKASEHKNHQEETIKNKVTCDIRLRVRAEYCNHESALEGNVHSHKPEQIERRFEKFMQANTILKARDLGSIVCDIKFSELTYLDAFWRDYINGSLLEALKGVFITESLKQAVGHEAIKLLVNVDEDDYEAGRVKLLENLRD